MKALRFGITGKLFLAILLTSLASVLLMALTVRYRFHHDFLRYVNQSEVQRLNILATELASRYRHDKNWNKYRGKPQAWLDFVRENSGFPMIHGMMMMHGEHMGMENQGQGIVPPGPALVNRLALLNADKAFVSGNRNRNRQATLVPILSGDTTVGWLSLNPAPRLTALADISFQENQSRSGLLIGLVAVSLAALAAMILARQFRSPIKRLADATRGLSAGDFSVRIRQTSRDELGQLQQDFNRLARTLEAHEKARRQWQADISHELRTPTAVLRGEIEALQDGIREVNADTLQSLHAEVLHINNIIEDLYQLSMSDIGALNYKKADIEITDIIEEVLASHEAQIKQHGLRTRIELDPCRSSRLFADPDRIRQLFGNLMQNSLRYTDSGGQLEIWCEARNKSLLLNWRDSSPGVSDESLPHLFERLYRPEESRDRRSGGAGLGLSICKNIVDAHEGKINARHSPTGGLWMLIAFSIQGNSS